MNADEEPMMPKHSNVSQQSNVSDRRVGRTRNLLSDALLELLRSTPWHKITVQRIIEHANVGRSTFYAHYDTKFDLLLAQLPLLEMSLEVADCEDLPNFLPLFEHVRDHAHAMQPTLAQPISGEITDHMHARLTKDWQRILHQHHGEHADELTAEYLAGATLAAMHHYLRDPSIAPPNDMAARLAELVANTLRPS